ncbi:MAG: SRPBCC family protein [Gammaproteobacteria bacterium]|nr:SRPBCC family protein [Gammaproteobacteria bacterium]MCP5091949.1 SRPBCC family protein [Gammaproteobacteria bacterium]
MAIEIKETFQVEAPIDQVWGFMTNAENLAACMPGASLTETIDDRNFVGAVKLKVGAITARYHGNISFVEMDENAGLLKLLAEAKEKGGGTVNCTISTRLIALSEGHTEAQCESSTDLTGRIVQVSRGMIEGVSQQIIQEFVGNVKSSLELTEAAGAARGDTTAQAPTATQAADSINVLAVVWNVIRQAVVRFFKRLFGRT